MRFGGGGYAIPTNWERFDLILKSQIKPDLNGTMTGGQIFASQKKELRDNYDR